MQRSPSPLLLALALLVAGCAANPATLVVLLPEADGKVGRVAVSTDAGSQELSAASQASGASARNAAPVTAFALSPKRINALFGDAIAAQPALPQTFILYFEPNSSVLTGESATLVPQIVAAIKARTAPDISVIGHSDRVGSNDINVPISTQRAQVVADLLAQAGIDRALMETDSHGEENPLVPTEDNVSEPRNRRVEVTVR